MSSLTILRNLVQRVKSYLGMLYQYRKEFQNGDTPTSWAGLASHGTFPVDEMNPFALFKHIGDSYCLERVSQNLLQLWIDSELKLLISVSSNRLHIFQIYALFTRWN